MKQYILFLFLIIGSTLFAQKVDSVFMSMPDELLPHFSEANRTMLLMDSALTKIPYELGEIEKLEYNNSFLSIRTSEVATLQIKLLPLVNNTNIIAVVKTVCAKVCDSNIRFFTEQWDEIDKSEILPTIPPSTFFDVNEENKAYFREIALNIDIYPLYFVFTKDDDNLKATFDFSNHLSSQNFKEIKPYIKSTTVDLIWNKAAFVL